MSEQNQKNPVSLRDVQRLIVRHRWRFILPAFGTALVVLGVSLALPRQYEAQGIFERRNDLVMSEIADRGAPQSFDLLKRSLNEELTGIPAIEKAIDDLRLIPKAAADAPFEVRQRLATQRQDLMQTVRKRVMVMYDVSTNEVDRIRVVYTAKDPQLARRVVNRLIENYIDRSRKKVDQMLGQAASFFRKQVDECKANIDTLEGQRLKFEIDNASFLPVADGSGAVIQDGGLKEQLAMLQQQQQAAGLRVSKLREQLGGVGVESEPTSIVKGPNPEIGRLAGELAEARGKLERAVTVEKMTDQHPTVVVLRAKVESIRASMEALPAEVVTQRVYSDAARRGQLDQAILQASTERDALGDQIAGMEKRIDKARLESTAALPLRAEYRKFVRAIEDAQRQSNFWEDNLRRVQMALTAELGQRGITMDFLKPCGPIARPSSPNLMQVLMAALGLGCAAGVSFVLMSERSDQTLSSLDQVGSGFGVPVLGAVAEIVTERHRQLRRWLHQVVYPLAVASMLALAAGGAYLNFVSLRSPFMWANGQLAQLDDSGLRETGPDDPKAGAAITEVPVNP